MFAVAGSGRLAGGGREGRSERGQESKGKKKKKKNLLRAVSMPQLEMTQGAAPCVSDSLFSHTHAKSVTSHGVSPMAFMMQSSEHSGKMEMSCAETPAAAAASVATRAAVYFIFVVVVVVLKAATSECLPRYAVRPDESGAWLAYWTGPDWTGCLSERPLGGTSECVVRKKSKESGRADIRDGRGGREGLLYFGARLLALFANKRCVTTLPDTRTPFYIVYILYSCSGQLLRPGTPSPRPPLPSSPR